MDERGVSEVLSFVLVFGIILSSVVFVGLVGFDSIQNYQEVEQLGNAERAMDAFADNANDIVRYDGVDRRAGTLTLREGTVEPGASGTHLSVLVTSDTGEDLYNSSDHYSEDIGAFTYKTGTDTIAYEGGGVFRSTDDGQSVVRSDPMVTCREDDIAMISLVVVNSSDQTIHATEGVTFDIQERDNRSNRTVFNDADTLTVDLEEGTGQAAGWQMYFEHSDGWDDPNDEWEWVCDDVDRVSIDIVEADISYPEVG